MFQRICAFCDFKADYEDFPNGSICYLGIAACAECLKTEKTKELREIIEAETEWNLTQQTQAAASTTVR